MHKLKTKQLYTLVNTVLKDNPKQNGLYVYKVLKRQGIALRNDLNKEAVTHMVRTWKRRKECERTRKSVKKKIDVKNCCEECVLDILARI